MHRPCIIRYKDGTPFEHRGKKLDIRPAGQIDDAVRMPGE